MSNEDGGERVASISAKQCNSDPSEVPRMNDTAEQGTISLSTAA